MSEQQKLNLIQALMLMIDMVKKSTIRKDMFMLNAVIYDSELGIPKVFSISNVFWNEHMDRKLKIAISNFDLNHKVTKQSVIDTYHLLKKRGPDKPKEVKPIVNETPKAGYGKIEKLKDGGVSIKFG